MRIVVTGATGNVGTSVVRALGSDASVDEIVGVARRTPEWNPPRTQWVSADIGRDDLRPLFAGADVVVHLAWLIQPSRDAATLERVNVDGSRRVFEAAAEAGVERLVHASSVGVYSPGPKDRAVDESWPREGIASSFYSRHKVAAEDALDVIEADVPQLRVVRLRPALIFQREAGPEVRRLFAGPLLPARLVRPGVLPVLPLPEGLVVQGVHADDVADAYVRAVVSDVRGPFNIAADPVLDAQSLTGRFGGMAVPVAPGVLRASATATWRARLQPTEPGWVGLAMRSPLLSWQRATAELGWRPRVSALDALVELFDGMAHRTGGRTAVLRPRPAASTRLAAMLAGHLPGHGDPY
jgi:nucleoside-diphosphate-sugar epimerase